MPHRLRGNASSALPTRLIFVDTETRPRPLRDDLLEHELRLGVACFWQRAGAKQPEREEWLDFTHAEAFWSWLERRAIAGKRLVLFAHNTQFDLQALGGPQELARRGWTVPPPVIDSERVILRAKREGASLLVLDWFNYFRAPLEKAAELLALDYVPLPAQTDPDEAWRARCRNDVLILRVAVARWLGLLEREDLGLFAPTLASQALHAYRHRFMDHEILVGSVVERPKLERAAYMGGRAEVLAVGTFTDGPYSMLDVNSMYAAVMGRFNYPCRLKYVRRRTGRADLAETLKSDLVIAEVELETEVPIFPAKVEGRLEFPVGRFTTTLTTPELAEAVRRGVIRRVGECAVYEGAPLFERWAREIFDLRIRLRVAGEPLLEDMVRHMLQALYGKFGQHSREWERRADEPGYRDEIWTELDADLGLERTFRRLGGVVAERKEEGEAHDAFPAIPAHVTAHARLLLWRYVELAGLAHVLYLDTDALIVDAAGRAALERWIDPDVLGRLKVAAEGPSVTIEGPKVYRIGEVDRRKGIRADAELLDSGKYRQEEFLGLNAQLRRGHSGGPLVQVVERAPARPLPPERISPAGRVLPRRLEL